MNRRLLKQFTLRELLALVVIVALALGWSLDHRQLSNAADEAAVDAHAWRMRAGTLERFAKDFGLEVTWYDEFETLWVVGYDPKLDKSRSRGAFGMPYEPSQSLGDWNELQAAKMKRSEEAEARQSN